MEHNIVGLPGSYALAHGLGWRGKGWQVRALHFLALHATMCSDQFPMPSQRLIPSWLGGAAEPVLKRAAPLGDGWMPAGRLQLAAGPYCRHPLFP